MIRPFYIVAVWLIGARAFFVAAEKAVFRDQKNFFFSSLRRAHGRMEEGKLCGEVVKT
jgi:hypothetical protein